MACVLHLHACVLIYLFIFPFIFLFCFSSGHEGKPSLPRSCGGDEGTPGQYWGVACWSHRPSGE
jgi:hypothetical protein